MTAKKGLHSEEELKELISVEVAGSSAEVAESVFHKLFEDEKEKMNSRVSKLIYGGMIAAIFLFASLIVSVWVFMAGYQQHYLETQQTINERSDQLEKDYNDLKIQTQTGMQKIEDKQDYTDRYLLESKVK